MSIVVLAAGILGSVNLFNYTTDDRYDPTNPFAGFAVGLAAITVSLGLLMFAVGAYIETKTNSEDQ